MTLYLYQRAQKQKIAFIPQKPNEVSLYVCGPTVYSTPHIGNARPAVVFDCLSRLLRQLFTKVTNVRNITDVDDKINAKAAQEGVEIDVITKRYTQCYHDDLAALGCLAPDVEPRATEHMAEMQAMITTLIEKGHAYESKAHVLFAVPSFAGYGAVSGRDEKARQAGARIAVEDYKRHEEDFVLWKPSEAHEPGWPSPWGRGRPGWHIECSAMINKHLGLPIDIHGGGGDLLFPHHENEHAQGCCYQGTESYAHYWVHNGMVKVDDEKMSKSLGNILLVRDLLQDHPGEAIRLALLQTHYRQPLLWQQQENAQLAKQQLDKAYRLMQKIEVQMDGLTWGWEDMPADIQAALCDDLNTPLAIHHWSAMCKRMMQQAQVTDADIKALLAVQSMLGIVQMAPQQWFQGAKDRQMAPEAIEKALADRDQARKDRDYQRADDIRNALAEQGVSIEDAGGKTTWRYS